MEELALSIPSERLIGFTIPQEGRFLVCDHNKVWEVAVGDSTAIVETDLAPYEVAARQDFVGGDSEAAQPVLSVGDVSISYAFDPKAEALDLHYRVNEDGGKISFWNFSGDWFAASLSREGNLLVLAEPYRIELYRTRA